MLFSKNKQNTLKNHLVTVEPPLTVKMINSVNLWWHHVGCWLRCRFEYFLSFFLAIIHIVYCILVSLFEDFLVSWSVEDFFNLVVNSRYIQGGPAKVRPTYVFDGFECIGRIQ